MTEAPPPPTRELRPSGLARRALVVAVVLLVVAVAGFVAAAFLPRWWSHRVGAQAGGSMTAGIALGLFYGFVFTVLPLALLRWSFRKRRRWKVWAVSLGLAVVLAAPNLLTLGIVLGSGNAAHAGERTLDVDAPGFRTSALIGAVSAVAAYAVLEYLLFSRRRTLRQLARLSGRPGGPEPRPGAPSGAAEEAAE